jgi:hypothetical protein
VSRQCGALASGSVNETVRNKAICCGHVTSYGCVTWPAAAAAAALGANLAEGSRAVQVTCRTQQQAYIMTGVGITV